MIQELSKLPDYLLDRPAFVSGKRVDGWDIAGAPVYSPGDNCLQQAVVFATNESEEG